MSQPNRAHKKKRGPKPKAYHAKQPKLSFGGYSAGGGSSAPAAASSSSTPPAAALPNETLPSQAGTSAEGSAGENAEMADAEHKEDVQNALPFVAQAVMVMLSPVLLGSEQLIQELMSQLPRAAGRRMFRKSSGAKGRWCR